MLPSLWELAGGNLSAVTLLVRLALALAVCAVLVWALTGMVLRYARMHAQPVGRERGIRHGLERIGQLTPQLGAPPGRCSGW